MEFFDLKHYKHPYLSYNPTQEHLMGGQDEFRENSICSIAPVCATIRIQSICCALSWQLQSSKLFKLEPILMYVFCSINIQIESEGHRGMLKFSPSETLSHGVQGESLPFDSGGCKRNKRFSHLSGFWTHPYWHSTKVVSRGRPWAGLTTNSICSGLNNDRPLLVNLSMCTISQKQGSYKIAYPSGPSWSNTMFCWLDYWQDPRCEYDGCRSNRRRFDLRNGQRLSGFPKTVSSTCHAGILCNKSEAQYEVSPFVLKSCRQDNGHSSRSKYSSCRLQIKNSLSGNTAPSALLRCPTEQKADISDKPFRHSGKNSSGHLSLALAGRTVFQMDQAAPENKKILRDISQCSENTNLDSNQHLPAGSDCQKETETARQFAHNSTSFGG